MVSHKSFKPFVVYVAVVLLIFALSFPVLQKKLWKKSPPADLQTAQVVDKQDSSLLPSSPPASPSSVVTPLASAPVLEVNLSEFVWPLEGQVFRGVGLSYSQTFSDYRYHDGIDIQAARGAEVVAALAGRVSQIETTKGEGMKITLEHGQGWESVYAHLEESYLSVGAYCQAGDPIGIVNQPGLQEVTEGPHLHYTLRCDGEVKNPLDYLPEML